MNSLLLVGFVTLHAVSFAASQGCSCGSSARRPGPLQYYQVNDEHRRWASQMVFNSIQKFPHNFAWAVRQTGLFQDNLVYSPFSIAMALSMLTYGTTSNVSDELCRVLNLPSNGLDHIKPGFQNLIDGLKVDEEFTIRLATKIYIPCRAGLQRDFASTATHAFRSEVEALNFGNPVCASRTINEWCFRQTNGLINNIVSPDDVSNPGSIVLINALYFRGSWENPFDPSSTKLRNFYRRNPNQGFVSRQSHVPLQFMNANNAYNYGILPTQFDATFVDLLYTGQGVRMLIILPNSLDGLELVERNLNTITLQGIIRMGRPTQVELSLPKISIESTLDLKDVFQRVNVNGIFRRSSITRISDQPLSVSKIVHKAVLKIDEYGTEAAAVTATDLTERFGGATEGHAKFIADHPFVVLLIMENNVGFHTLFAGRYTGFPP